LSYKQLRDARQPDYKRISVFIDQFLDILFVMKFSVGILLFVLVLEYGLDRRQLMSKLSVQTNGA